jgi:hypothetical protein
MKKVAIVLDNWKLPIFRKALENAGFEYEDGGEITADSTLLRVNTADMDGLTNLVFACQRKCEKERPC